MARAFFTFELFIAFVLFMAMFSSLIYTTEAPNFKFEEACRYAKIQRDTGLKFNLEDCNFSCNFYGVKSCAP